MCYRSMPVAPLYELYSCSPFKLDLLTEVVVVYLICCHSVATLSGGVVLSNWLEYIALLSTIQGLCQKLYANRDKPVENSPKLDFLKMFLLFCQMIKSPLLVRLVVSILWQNKILCCNKILLLRSYKIILLFCQIHKRYDKRWFCELCYNMFFICKKNKKMF